MGQIERHFRIVFAPRYDFVTLRIVARNENCSKMEVGKNAKRPLAKDDAIPAASGNMGKFELKLIALLHLLCTF